jgi:zinc D-Ala-D-Ala carboxypeptidase
MTWKHFSPAVDVRLFRCNCHQPDCDAPPVNTTLVDLLDMAREMAGVPFAITSGPRCLNYNNRIWGAHNSAHIRGLAADIACTDMFQRKLILSALTAIGCNRIGIAKTFIHADIDGSLPQGIYVK